MLKRKSSIKIFEYYQGSREYVGSINRKVFLCIVRHGDVPDILR